MAGRAEGQACADPGARTLIGPAAFNSVFNFVLRGEEMSETFLMKRSKAHIAQLLLEVYYVSTFEYCYVSNTGSAFQKCVDLTTYCRQEWEGKLQIRTITHNTWMLI